MIEITSLDDKEKLIQEDLRLLEKTLFNYVNSHHISLDYFLGIARTACNILYSLFELKTDPQRYISILTEYLSSTELQEMYKYTVKYELTEIEYLLFNSFKIKI